ncbi:acidic fibroblast growth factor intracellular-binding protein-like [Gigantopelta aegis]|uniref:acidic fibroblast growth factor intracellular-binding protein-like n=1 Tax=Gigantopelta aegis TaxID=1735272 RepID=UPI001B88BB22|nr:acidic fibroblast growth factor intracellular-binding protein-like [Gigantopelta aegis]
MSEVDVFVGNHTIIDTDLYELWLKGCLVNEAASILQKQGILHTFSATIDDLVSDTVDNFRLFVNLEKLLKNPTKVQDQQIYQIDPDTQKMIIERYYQFDAPVIREMLGKKLTSRHRKDLDDVSDKTGIPLRSCRRQFDNIKRVFKTVEELKGSLVENIRTHYLLSEELARDYAAIVFITNNRFETRKKKLSYLSFKDFAFCANLMITNWSYSSVECKSHEDMDVDLDRDFLLQLRELKVLMDKEYLDEHKSIVLKMLNTKIVDKTFHDLDTSFKNFSKTILNIANGLNHSKESRDIFLDLYEKLIEPCVQYSWSRHDLNLMLQAYKDAVPEMGFFKKVSPQLQPVWDRYMNTLINCVSRMYPNQ